MALAVYFCIFKVHAKKKKAFQLDFIECVI